MILPRRRLLVPKTKHQVIDCTSFSSGMNTEVDPNLLPFQRACLSYNFSGKSGALTQGVGIRELHLPSEINPSGEKKIKSTDSSEFLHVWQLRHFSNQTNSRNDGIVVLK